MNQAGPVGISRKQAILLLRWVVIIATSYVVALANRAPDDYRAPFFIAGYLTTNVIASFLPPTAFERSGVLGGFVILDTILITLGMTLSGEASADLFLVYFSVLFVAALGENLTMIVTGCVFIAFLYVFLVLRAAPADDLMRSAFLLRIPLLFGVGAFFGYLVVVAKEERRRAEAALEHERYRTDFLATLTHDLQSPLSAITGFADLLDMEVNPAERLRMLNAIKQATRQCHELVANFLSVARQQAGLDEPTRRRVDLGNLAGEVRLLHAPRAAEKKVTLELEVEEGLPEVSGDVLDLRRALSNLVANAIRFSPEGKTVGITVRRDGTSAVELAVTDMGPGVHESMREHLFDRYVRDEEGTGGTGLGLFVCRLVAEAHGGSIQYSRPSGKGARFGLRLPLPADQVVAAR